MKMFLKRTTPARSSIVAAAKPYLGFGSVFPAARGHGLGGEIPTTLASRLRCGEILLTPSGASLASAPLTLPAFALATGRLGGSLLSFVCASNLGFPLSLRTPTTPVCGIRHRFGPFLLRRLCRLSASTTVLLGLRGKNPLGSSVPTLIWARWPFSAKVVLFAPFRGHRTSAFQVPTRAVFTQRKARPIQADSVRPSLHTSNPSCLQAPLTVVHDWPPIPHHHPSSC